MYLSFARNGRLRYDEAHGVLICLECRYAVQKSAVESHLLRHKIYRGERRTLLAAISRMHLVESDEVTVPSGLPGGGLPAPVEGLAIIPGYRCAADGCEALCASDKRMRRHWSEIHGTTDRPGSPAAAMATEAHLQTFFRGTKLKYFRVRQVDETSGVSSGVPSMPSSGIPSGVSRYNPSSAATPDIRLQRTASIAVVSGQPAATAPSAPPPLLVEMESLQYLHHFVSTTSLTLPPNVDGSTAHWQTDGVVRALQSRWLMCRVLAVAASHKSAEERDPEARRLHHNRALQFQAEIPVNWCAQTGDERRTMEVCAQLGSVLSLCQITGLSNRPGGGKVERLEWSHLANVMLGCQDPSVIILLVTSGPPPASDPAPVQSRVLAAGVPNRAPPTLLKMLRELPFRMAMALSKPDSHEDLVAVVSAIEILADCYLVSYASGDDEEGDGDGDGDGGGAAAWLGMTCWLREVPPHFNGMLERQIPAALIVLAHWCQLVRRAEMYFWFLRGLGDEVVRGILSQVPDDAAIRELIDACRGSL